MKLTKTASGKKIVKMSKKEWLELGKTAGWIKKAAEGETPEAAAKRIIDNAQFGIPVYEIISQFEGIIKGNDFENLRQYYPTWNDNDFLMAIKLLKPHER